MAQPFYDLSGYELNTAVAAARGWPQFESGAHQIGTRPYPFFWQDPIRKIVYVDYGPGDDRNEMLGFVQYNPASDLNLAWELLREMFQLSHRGEGFPVSTLILITRQSPADAATEICRAYATWSDLRRQ